MKSTDPRPRRLISDRFRYTGGEIALPQDSQQRTMRTFLDRVKTGAYRFVSDPCPCAQPVADVVVAEVDCRSRPCYAWGAGRSESTLT